MLRHFLHTVKSLVNLTIALKTEGDGHNTNGENTHFLGYACNDWCGTCSCTTTHTGCDKGHTCSVTQHILDILDTLLSSSTSLFGLVTCSKTFLTQLQMNRDGRVVECLIVCITEYEGNVVDTFTIHVVDGITTSATDTNHLDDAVFFFGCSEIQ